MILSSGMTKDDGDDGLGENDRTRGRNNMMGDDEHEDDDNDEYDEFFNESDGFLDEKCTQAFPWFKVS